MAGAHRVTDELVGVYAKIARAEEHVEALRREMRSYFEGPPPAISGEIEFDLKAGRVDYGRLHYAPVPTRVQILIGDAAVALRCSLDHLAWQLVLKDGGIPTPRTYFPIWENPRTDRHGHRSPPDIVGGVSNRAIQIIEAVQPYMMAAWSEHSLLVLDRLAKIDKHRTLVSEHKVTNDLLFEHPETDGITFSVSVGAVHDEYAELSLTSVPAHVKLEVPAYITVSDEKGQDVPPIKFLTAAAQYVRHQVVGPIERDCF
jgi:hypothetical protein